MFPWLLSHHPSQGCIPPSAAFSWMNIGWVLGFVSWCGVFLLEGWGGDAQGSAGGSESPHQHPRASPKQM